MGPTRQEESIPDPGRFVGRYEKLEAQLTGDTGARDHDPCAFEMP